MSTWHPPNSDHPPPKPGEPPLHRAARLGDHRQIRALVADGADVSDLFEIQLDPGARNEPATAMMVAAGSSYGASVETLALLVELGASIEQSPQLSPVPYACAGLGWNYPPGGDADRLAFLLANGADPQAKLRNGASALACAAGTGDVERIRLLLSAGADPNPENEKDFDGFRMFLPFLDPLSMAAQSGSAGCVRLLLDAGADLHRYAEGEEQPLSGAGSLEALEALLAAGADPKHTMAGRGSVVGSVARNYEVPLEERVKMLQALRAAGADLNGPPKPLFVASLDADDEAVEALLRAGADPLTEPTGLTGVCFAAMVGPRPEVDRVIDLLVGAGLDPDAPDAAGLRPLHAAMSPDQYGPDYAESDGFNEPAALALIRLGVTIDIAYPENGFRPLHAAAVAGSAAVVKALLRAGANPADVSKDGRTALDVAREAGATACVRVLERAEPPA